MSDTRAKRPVAFWLLFFLLLFQGIAATPSGLMLILDPTGGMLQMPVRWLARSPFPDYLIPGLILAIVLLTLAPSVRVYLSEKETLYAHRNPRTRAGNA